MLHERGEFLQLLRLGKRKCMEIEIDHIQKNRIQNLRILNALVESFGSTTSQVLYKFLIKKNVKITKTDISLIYHKKRKISEKEARAIELAFDMPLSWMDRDNIKLFLLDDEYINLIDSFSKIETKWKKLIIHLIDTI